MWRERGGICVCVCGGGLLVGGGGVPAYVCAFLNVCVWEGGIDGGGGGVRG